MSDIHGQRREQLLLKAGTGHQKHLNNFFRSQSLDHTETDQIRL